MSVEQTSEPMTMTGEVQEQAAYFAGLYPERCRKFGGLCSRFATLTIEGAEAVVWDLAAVSDVHDVHQRQGIMVEASCGGQTIDLSRDFDNVTCNFPPIGSQRDGE